MLVKLHIPLILLAIFSNELALSADIVWENLDDGLSYARIAYNKTDSKIDSSLHVLKIDPGKWDFTLMSASEMKLERNLTVKEWCNRYGLTAGINAGMYDLDRSTHIGLLKNFDHNNNAAVHSKYHSIAVFNPESPGQIRFRILDLDVPALEGKWRQYHSAVQNLRLIKNPRQNRWEQRDKKWSEAALAEDKNGHALFILCTFPLSMHDFNEMILKCPLKVVAAQHLEGGVEAQFYLKYNGREIDVNGGFESRGIISSGAGFKTPVPNIIGIKKKQ